MMARGIGIAMILALLAGSAFGQDTLWTRNYGFAGESDLGMCGDLMSDGGFVVSGISYNDPFPNGDAWVVRCNHSGDTLWTRNYGGTYNQEPHFISETSDGGVILTGKFNYGVGAYDMGIIKLGPNGDSLWSNHFGNPGSTQDEGNMVIELADHNYIAVGYIRNTTTDLYMVKMDSLGNMIWSRSYGSSLGSDYAYGVVELADGGFAVTGSVYSSTSTSDLWLLRTESDGDTLWTRKFDYHGDKERGDNIVQADNGDFVIGGRTWNGTYAQLIGVRVDSLGNQIWASEFGSLSDGEFAESIDKTSDGGFVIGGGKGISSFDFYVVRLDANGDSVWATIYNGATGRSDDCYEIRVDSNNDILAFGYTDVASVNPSDLQFWVVKIDDGAIQGGDPDIDLSPLAYVDTVEAGSLAADTLQISNLGNAALIYGLHGSEGWISVAPDTGLVPAAGVDTAAFVLDATALTPGTYSGQVGVNSNDPDEPQVNIPVTLVVQPSSGCDYIPGDINGNGTPNGIDVVYGVTYLKGGATPRDSCDCRPTVPTYPFYGAMDVNGNCATNGIDITFYVAYLKGLQPALKWCLDCPPAVR